MVFKQKKGDFETHYEFHPNNFTFYIKDEVSKGEFTIEYETILPDRYELIRKNAYLKRAAIWMLCAGILLIMFMGFILLIIAAVCYVNYRRSTITFTVIETTMRKLYIIKDKEHDAILKALDTAHKEYILRKYGKINSNNHPYAEIKKFEMLLSRKIITEKEFEEIIKQLQPQKEQEKKRLN